MVAFVLVLLSLGCGDDGGGASAPSDGAVEAALAERYGADAEQATCMRARLTATMDPAELAVVVDEGLPGLPQARWDRYLGAVITCLTLEPDER